MRRFAVLRLFSRSAGKSQARISFVTPRGLRSCHAGLVALLCEINRGRTAFTSSI